MSPGPRKLFKVQLATFASGGTCTSSSESLSVCRFSHTFMFFSQHCPPPQFCLPSPAWVPPGHPQGSRPQHSSGSVSSPQGFPVSRSGSPSRPQLWVPLPPPALGPRAPSPGRSSGMRPHVAAALGRHARSFPALNAPDTLAPKQRNEHQKPLQVCVDVPSVILNRKAFLSSSCRSEVKTAGPCQLKSQRTKNPR